MIECAAALIVQAISNFAIKNKCCTYGFSLFNRPLRKVILARRAFIYANIREHRVSRLALYSRRKEWILLWVSFCHMYPWTNFVAAGCYSAALGYFLLFCIFMLVYSFRWFFLYSCGDIPYLLRKTRLKYVTSLNPEASAASIILILPSRIRSTAFCNFIRLRYSLKLIPMCCLKSLPKYWSLYPRRFAKSFSVGSGSS